MIAWCMYVLCIYVFVNENLLDNIYIYFLSNYVSMIYRMVNIEHYWTKSNQYRTKMGKIYQKKIKNKSQRWLCFLEGKVRWFWSQKGIFVCWHNGANSCQLALLLVYFRCDYTVRQYFNFNNSMQSKLLSAC